MEGVQKKVNKYRSGKYYLYGKAEITGFGNFM